MPSKETQREESPAFLVARFLRSNNFTETLTSFLSEAGLPPDAGATDNPTAPTIESILREKRDFDLTQRFERTGVDDDDAADKELGWRSPAPGAPHTVSSLPAAANILHVGVHSAADGNSSSTTLLVSTAGHNAPYALDSTAPYTLRDTPAFPPSNTRVLCWTAIAGGRALALGDMAGRVALYDAASGALLDERWDHDKYVVKVAAFDDAQGTWLATAAWDRKVLLYRVVAGTAYPATTAEGAFETRNLTLDALAGQIKLATNPADILFVTDPDGKPVLLVSRQDSTLLEYFAPPDDESATASPATLTLLGRQNLAPHSNAWIAFTPAALALCPTDKSMLAVATSHMPHMKLILVRLLFPSKTSADLAAPASTAEPATSDPDHMAAAAQSRRLLALQSREDAAIAIQVSTRAPQTRFSTPVVAWRPDGSGVWVNGDDGAVRGVEARSGKVVCTLGEKDGGHEAGSKVRCLWSGLVDGREVMVSGGFDRRLVVWTCPGGT